MHTALKDLGLGHLWVIYPGKDSYPLADRLSVLSITEVPALVNQFQTGGIFP